MKISTLYLIALKVPGIKMILLLPLYQTQNHSTIIIAETTAEVDTTKNNYKQRTRLKYS